MVGRRKDSTKELAKELKETLTPDEAEGMLAIIRAKKGMQVEPKEFELGNNGQFAEPTVKDMVPVVPEQVKIVISQMLGIITDDLNKTIMTSEVPGDILRASVIAKTREERRDPIYRAMHPNESPRQTLMKNLYIHLMAWKRQRSDELLRIAELETDKGHEGNIPLSYGQ